MIGKAITIFVLYNYVTTIAANIAKITGFPRTTVQDYVKRLKSGQGIERKPGSSSKRKLSADDRRCLTQLALNHPKFSGEELADELAKRLNKTESRGQVFAAVP
ncbi:hypothetical protein FQR65_LT00530 [Abscondita terminalis]|nr:hypothetical protein FQR65_LT00530 [Abscondita terminalis]